jgi:hypothetical protein
MTYLSSVKSSLSTNDPEPPALPVLVSVAEKWICDAATAGNSSAASSKRRYVLVMVSSRLLMVN